MFPTLYVHVNTCINLYLSIITLCTIGEGEKEMDGAYNGIPILNPI